MSVTDLIVLLAVDILGLFLIYFLLRRRIEKALSLDSLLESIRKEVRALNIELNETTDRNISLIEDRVKSLHDLLDEADRRIGVAKRELGRRETEAEVYTQLGRAASRIAGAPPPEAAAPGLRGSALAGQTTAPAARSAAPGLPAGTAGLSSGASPASGGARTAGAQPDTAARPAALPGGAPEQAGYQTEPIRLPLGGDKPSLQISQGPDVIPPKTLREAALDLYRRGFSAEIIANKLGATVAEIELLISLEEGSRGQF